MQTHSAQKVRLIFGESFLAVPALEPLTAVAVLSVGLDVFTSATRANHADSPSLIRRAAIECCSLDWHSGGNAWVTFAPVGRQAFRGFSFETIPNAFIIIYVKMPAVDQESLLISGVIPYI